MSAAAAGAAIGAEVSAAIGLIAAGSATAAMAPLGTVLFVAGVAVLFVEGALRAHRSNETAFQSFQRELADVERDELRIERRYSAARDEGDRGTTAPPRRPS